MPLVTFFSVLELPEKNRKEQPPPLVRRGLNQYFCCRGYLAYACALVTWPCHEISRRSSIFGETLVKMTYWFLWPQMTPGELLNPNYCRRYLAHAYAWVTWPYHLICRVTSIIYWRQCPFWPLWPHMTIDPRLVVWHARVGRGSDQACLWVLPEVEWREKKCLPEVERREKKCCQK